VDDGDEPFVEVPTPDRNQPRTFHIFDRYWYADSEHRIGLHRPSIIRSHGSRLDVRTSPDAAQVLFKLPNRSRAGSGA